MKLEVLVSAMVQTDESLVHRMNLQTDALIVNQHDHLDLQLFEHNGHVVRMMSFPERGVGLSRNTALMRAHGDICLFADESVVYHDDYERKVLEAFERRPTAGLIAFNMRNLDPNRSGRPIMREERMRRRNSGRFGAPNIAVRRSILLSQNVFFSLRFGGGAEYGAGEDTAFLWECLAKGIKAYTCADELGTIAPHKSSWFDGFTEKYFFDKGVAYGILMGRAAWPAALAFMIRRRGLWATQLPARRAFAPLFRGVQRGRRELRGLS